VRKTFVPGPQARTQLARIAGVWKQGEHVLICGGTGSGKTLLARQLAQMRLDRGGSVISFIAKTQPDDTLTRYYSDWTRWKKWKARPSITDTRVLLWPDMSKMTLREARETLKGVYREALDGIGKQGRWTVIIDEGLFTTSATGLGFGDDISLLSQMIRSAHGTLILLAQRPSHLPLSVYANTSHAFVARAPEDVDKKRLANLDNVVPSAELRKMIDANRRHDFLWIPVAPGWEPERINLSR
jgi:energy-coupling factor transporter ATP-binding protein EcfA2